MWQKNLHILDNTKKNPRHCGKWEKHKNTALPQLWPWMLLLSSSLYSTISPWYWNFLKHIKDTTFVLKMLDQEIWAPGKTHPFSMTYKQLQVAALSSVKETARKRFKSGLVRPMRDASSSWWAHGIQEVRRFFKWTDRVALLETASSTVWMHRNSGQAEQCLSMEIIT